MDSGASHHMTDEGNALQECTELKSPISIKVADGSTIRGLGMGSLPLSVQIGSVTKQMNMKDVLYVPDLNGTLFSVRASDERGYSTTFKNGRAFVRDSNGKLKAIGHM